MKHERRNCAHQQRRTAETTAAAHPPNSAQLASGITYRRERESERAGEAKRVSSMKIAAAASEAATAASLPLFRMTTFDGDAEILN